MSDVLTRKIPNIRHLRVFSQVCQCGSISQAAEIEHLSQPAVTQAVAKLERDMQVTLLHRQRATMTPSAIGIVLFHRVETALEHLHMGAREAIRLGNKRGGRGFSNFDRLLTTAQLHALVALSRSQNFTLAARLVGISQPSLHRSARNLERLAGMSFFTATPEGVSISPAANALSLHTRLALAELTQGLDEIAAHLGRDSTLINVGSMPLARTSILPQAINALVRQTDTIQVRTVDGPYAELLHGLRHGDIDCLIGALRDPVPVDDVEQEVLFDDPLALVVGAQHPLAGKKNITLADTLEFPWVAPGRDTPAGNYLYETLRIADHSPNPIRVISGSLVLLRGLLTSENYITTISLHQIQHELKAGSLVPLDIDLSGNSRSIGLTTRLGWRPTKTQELFLELLRQAAKGLLP